MSRHVYRPPKWPSDFSLAVGFDPALETFFAQVMNDSLGQDDDCVIVWLTPRPREILDPDQLVRIVNRRTRGSLPPVRLTQRMRDRLTRDMRREDEGRWIAPPRGKRPLCASDLSRKV
jgi:hypothetical protein